MKTAVSLPDTLFRQCEKLARNQRISRSALYQRALAAYLAAQTDITEQIDAALEAIGEDPQNDTWVKAVTRHALGLRSPTA